MTRQPKSMVPKVRFKGFTDEWEQRKLGEIATIVGGGTPSTKNPEYWDGDINWYSPAEIGNQIYTEKSERQITELGLKKSSAKLLPVGTVLFTSRAGIGKTAILNKEACTNQGFQSIIPRSKMLNSYFLFSRTNSLKQYGETMGSGSTFVEVSGKQMSKMPLFIPNINEQSRIAKLFQSLDKTITLHEEKQRQLEQLKKALLQKMFADKKHPKPELRFKGFSGDWEQRKFSEILAKSDGLRRGPFGSALKKEFFISSSEYTVYEQNNAIYNTWKTRYFITPEKFQELHKFQLMPGDFILSGAGTIGRIAQVPANITKGVFNQALIRIRINPEWMDKKFFLIWMQSENMQRKLTQANPGSAMTNLVPMSEIKKWEIIIPSKAEQNKIGEFIQKLNSLIALQQKQIDKLNSLKKSLLQNMFI